MIDIAVIHQDEHILVINKPDGVLTIADGYNPDLPHLKPFLEPEFGPLWIAHRLDKDTSGVMVLARTAEAHRSLNQQFKERQVIKIYYCLVNPVPTWQTIETNNKLLLNSGRKHLTRVDSQKGKPAQSQFSLISKTRDIALIRCQIKTGYRHQIRAHLYNLGLGILGDSLYKPKESTQSTGNYSRLMLHAYEISFSHPASKKMVIYSADIPQLFDEILIDYSHKLGY